MRNTTYTYNNKQYELSNHLENVLVTTSDLRKGTDNNADGIADYYNAIVTSANDYFAFGSLMPARQFNSTEYKFGFNGKENDNEVKGVGNQQDYGMRIYDPRLGKFLSVDPLTKDYPELTTYQFASNTPIQAIDLDGLEGTRLVNDMELPEGGGGNNAQTTPVQNTTEGTNTAAAAAAAAAASRVRSVTNTPGTIRNTPAPSPGSTQIQVTNPNNVKFNGQNNTNSVTPKQAFNLAKDQEGIPRSQQPIGQYITRDKNTGQPLRTYDYINSNGQPITIRRDMSRTYPDGGSQGPHYNSCNTNAPKLKTHHYYSTTNTSSGGGNARASNQGGYTGGGGGSRPSEDARTSIPPYGGGGGGGGGANSGYLPDDDE